MYKYWTLLKTLDTSSRQAYAFTEGLTMMSGGKDKRVVWSHFHAWRRRVRTSSGSIKSSFRQRTLTLPPTNLLSYHLQPVCHFGIDQDKASKHPHQPTPRRRRKNGVENQPMTTSLSDFSRRRPNRTHRSTTDQTSTYTSSS
jgi:hypothetical protein